MSQNNMIAMQDLTELDQANIEGGLTCEDLIIGIGGGMVGFAGGALGVALGAPLGPAGSIAAGVLWAGAGTGVGMVLGADVASAVCH